MQLTTHTTTTNRQSSNTKTTVLQMQVRSVQYFIRVFVEEILTAYYDAIISNVMKAKNISGLFWGVNLSLTPGVRIHGKGTRVFEEEIKSFF